MPRTRRVLARIVLALAGVIAGGGLLEGALRVRAHFHVGGAGETAIVRDARLGQRPRAGYADHDERGWRNPMAVQHADIVALGDSQTYGLGVQASATWPARIAAL